MKRIGYLFINTMLHYCNTSFIANLLFFNTRSKKSIHYSNTWLKAELQANNEIHSWKTYIRFILSGKVFVFLSIHFCIIQSIDSTTSLVA